MAQNKRIFGIQSLLSKIIIADNIMPALIDSGASISVIRADVFGKFSNFSPSLTLEASDIQASAINGSMLQFKGMCLLPCRWFKNGPMFSFKFYICAHLSVPCVVGFDLLHKQKCAVDFSRGLVDVGDAVLECISPLSQWFEDNSPTTETSLCSVTSRFLIPPRSEALIKCNLKSHHAHKFSSSSSRTSSDATVGLVEPHVGFTSLNSLLVASSLVTVSQNEFWLRVLNPTCNSVTLYPSQTIAQILPYNETVLQTVGFNAVDINSAETLMQLFKSKFSTLTKKQQKDAFSLLKQFADVFATDKWDLGSCNLHKLRIQLKDDAQPSRVPYRSMNPSKRKDLKDKITKLQEKDLISPTHSEWAAPTVLVPKRDGSYRLVIDYRKLNAQTVKTSWPLPRISDILNNLEGSIFFSSLDLCSGFHQMEIDEEDRHLTSFITPFGLYQWKRMPMGLCNAPGAFQRLMEIVSSGLTYEIVLVYLDDIIVFGRSFEEHIHRLQLVFQRIREANLKISPAKCFLFQTKLVFLGHVVSADGIHTDPAKIAAVEKYPVPQTIRQLRSFMGLVGFYRKFVLNFGLIANPLYQLMNKTTTFHWTADCQKAFNKLKTALVSAPILGFPNEKDQFVLCTDASLTGIGAVLSQKQKNGENVIAYASKVLQKGQRNYSATKRELFAVVFFTSYFKEFLLGQKFQIITDHRALVWLYSFKEPDAIVARWLEKLSMFNFEIVHRPGKTIANADALSRLPPLNLSATSVTSVSSSPHFSETQDQDKTLSVVKSWCRTGEKPPRSLMFGRPSALQCYWQQFETLKIIDGVLYRLFQQLDGSTLFHQCCVPLNQVQKVLLQLHDSPASGHLGNKKTLDRVRQRFYWPGLKNDVDSWISGCATCQKRKNPKQSHQQEMQLWAFYEPFLCVSVDILGPLPESRLNEKFYKYILMIGDHFTRWFEAAPLQNIKAETICSTFLDQWVTRFGVPEYIHSDNGSQFTSRLFADMCNKLQLTSSRSTPYHPQGNAKVERINRTLEDGLAKYCAERHEVWSVHLQSFMMAYRSAVHESTGQSPFRLVFGKEMRMPVDMLYPTLPTPIVGHRDYVFQRLVESSTIFESVIQKNGWEMRRQKAIFDKKKHGPSYKEGDLVLLHSPVCSQGQTPKLKSFWSGPHCVKKVINQINFVLQDVKTQKQQIAHYDRIKPFTPSDQRLRRNRSNQTVRPSPQPIVPEDDDLVLVDLSERQASTSDRLQNTTNPTSSAIPSPPVFLSENQSGSGSTTVPQRPRRAVADHARHPGFFRLAYFDSDSDVE